MIDKRKFYNYYTDDNLEPINGKHGPAGPKKPEAQAQGNNRPGDPEGSRNTVPDLDGNSRGHTGAKPGSGNRTGKDSN